MSEVTSTHEEKETLTVDVNIPGHDPRIATPLFTRTRKQLIERDQVCFISGMTAEQSGHPLEAHHHPIERSFAEMIDWQLFAADCKKGLWGKHAQAFDWDKFFEGAQTIIIPPSRDRETGAVSKQRTILKPKDPYSFVDDMTVNGMLLAKQFHTIKDMGIHMLPFPIFIAQKYGQEGYKFSEVEIIHHAQDGSRET